MPVITPLLQRHGGTWLASTFTPEDQEVARSAPAGSDQGGYSLRLLDIPSDMHREHYEVLSVGYLGYLFHRLFHLAHAPVFTARLAAAWESYRQVNRIYASAVQEVRDATVVLVEDHHLMFVGEELRRGRSGFDLPLAYFHHVPWCEPEYFDIQPPEVRDRILRGLLAYDVVGFHSSRWARAFVACCDRFLPEAECDDGRVQWRGRPAHVVVAPAPVDVAALIDATRSPGMEAWSARLEERRAGRRAIVRVDRADLWKNVLRGFAAFEEMLCGSPDLVDSVCFLAILAPTRMWLPDYRRYLRDCAASARSINERYASRALPGTMPVEMVIGNGDHHRALAAMRLADVLLVNPIADGLNVVAKEGPIVSDRDGVLVLSRTAGAYEELHQGAIGINPFDVLDTADAMSRGINMDPHERSRRAASLRSTITSTTPETWMRARLAPVLGSPAENGTSRR